MDRDTVRPVVLALLAVVAIGVAAATLNSAVVTDGSGGFGVGQPNSDAGAPNGSQPSFELGNQSSSGDVAPPLQLPCYPFLDSWWAIALIVAGFAGGAYVAYRRLGGLGVVAYAGPVGIPLLFAHAMLTVCSDPAENATSSFFEKGNVSLVPEGGSGAPGGSTGTSVTDPSVLLLAGLGVALLAAVALLFVSSSGEDPEEDEEFAEPDDGTDVRAVGRAAGEAADRIETTTDVDNEVFRAWREMTDHLDVPNPRSSTPSEFAAAAVEAGMAREDVDRLTTLFEEVRYGGESPTERREEQALDALRRIEREYAGRGASARGGRAAGAESAPDRGGDHDAADGSDSGPGGDAA
ncbi:DUF4129 domain-containing protein [Halorussus gelatinilyticus]|uniref:DUF4129 domain-containing protein n=1 Tax=Halorussus gelatinilyticus TaxID=2937524 RepID=A0A8U0IFC5_9EURY|nr:DUF4129 domain-containing protein [Halorussus gelatinilyticus]UPV98993.1 DUF4129 domain-containing protein [Halorussus gelatinilyticus]